MSDRENQNFIKCDICGETNDLDAKFCKSCGADLSKLSKEETSSSKTGKRKSQKKNDSGSKTLPADKSQVLTTTKLFYIVGSLIVIGAVILITSGTFDTVESGMSVSSNQFNEIHKGVDLNSLNEIKTLQETVDKNPNDYDSLLKLAHLQNDSGLYEKAVENYKKYLDKFPKNADVRVDMGVCYYQLGDYKNSIDAMETALKYQPKHQIAHLNLGIVNMAAGNHDKAVEWWEKTVQIDPNSEVGKRAAELLKSH